MTAANFDSSPATSSTTSSTTNMDLESESKVGAGAPTLGVTESKVEPIAEHKSEEVKSESLATFIGSAAAAEPEVKKKKERSEKQKASDAKLVERNKIRWAEERKKKEAALVLGIEPPKAKPRGSKKKLVELEEKLAATERQLKELQESKTDEDPEVLAQQEFERRLEFYQGKKYMEAKTTQSVGGYAPMDSYIPPNPFACGQPLNPPALVRQVAVTPQEEAKKQQRCIYKNGVPYYAV